VGLPREPRGIGTRFSDVTLHRPVVIATVRGAPAPVAALTFGSASAAPRPARAGASWSVVLGGCSGTSVGAGGLKGCRWLTSRF